MRRSPANDAQSELPRLGRCWLAAAVIVVITGPVLAAAGIGGSLWGLAGFLLIFAVMVTPLIARELRPPVRLVSSSERGRGAPRGDYGAHREF